jgi:hypothetical protein
MIRIREHKHKRLTRPVVATVLVRAALPADLIVTNTLIMIVAVGKEAAP